jgi:hypothetical protein
MEARGPTIDVFNIGGGRCRTCRQHPVEGPPSTSPASVVAAAGPAASTPKGPPLTSSTSVVAAVGNPDSSPQGACHRRLQLQWWPLLELSPAPPRGAIVDISSFGGGHCQTCRQHPQGAHRRQLQYWWWLLPEILTAPPGGPPSISPASVVAAAGPTAVTPQGGRHRCLQHRWWLLPEIPTATPRGPTIDVSSFSGDRCRKSQQHP